MEAALLVVALLGLCGCEPGVGRMISIDLAASCGGSAPLVRGENLFHDGRHPSQDVLDVVDEVAAAWGFKREAPEFEREHDRLYTRPISEVEEQQFRALLPGSHLILGVDHDSAERATVWLAAFRATQVVGPMRDIYSDLTRRLIERFGAENVRTGKRLSEIEKLGER